MTSLQGLLPTTGSTNWRKSRAWTSDSDEDAIVVRHVVIREVWLEKKPWPHAVYKIDVMSQTTHWFVFKRYKQFYALHQQLVKEYGVPRDFLPPRKLAKNMAVENLQNRREALQHYLQRILNSCNGAVSRSDELMEFLDVKSHDVAHVTYDLAAFLKLNGASILMSKDLFHMSPSQLYCITKQLQLPHPNKRIDLGNLYDFVAELSRLSVTDFISQSTSGEQHEIDTCSFDLSLFSSLKVLQLDACNIEAVNGMHCTKEKLCKLTARYCLSSMKMLLIDAALEKRMAPQVNLSVENWRVQAANRLMENRVVMQPWLRLTHINFSHNNISVFDSSMSLLPALTQLDLSYNKIHHLDLQLVQAPNLQSLSLAHNDIYMISGTTFALDSLVKINLSHNKIQTMEGLLSLAGLEDVNLSNNNIATLSEVKKLTMLRNLQKLQVAGNHMSKIRRHRVTIFAYFHGRELVLDNKPISRKEQAKIEAKVSAMEHLQDMDDSISSISTISDDSDFDSGFHGNRIIGRSQLDALLEAVPETTDSARSSRETLNESVGGLTLAEESLVASDDDVDERQCERLTRGDWDQILQARCAAVDAVGRFDDDDDDEVDSAACSPPRGSITSEDWHQTGARPKRLAKGDRQRLGTTSRDSPKNNKQSTSLARNTSAVDSKVESPPSPEHKSWRPGLFWRRKPAARATSTSPPSPSRNALTASPSNQAVPGVIILPEVEEFSEAVADISYAPSSSPRFEYEAAEECEECQECHVGGREVVS